MFLTAEWRSLAMLNYEVDPCLLLRFVPFGTDLDRWNGKTFVSLVGFRFLDTKVYGVRFPFHCNFDEINLRFYVRRQDETGVKRGVVFIKEVVPRRVIVAVARIVYNENYVALPTFHQIQPSEDGAVNVEYGWRTARGWNKMTLTARGEPGLPERGSHEEFITEHYWGYSVLPNSGCLEYQVAHPPWKVWTAQDARFEGDAVELYGDNLGKVLKRSPSSAFLAEGSDVRIFEGRRLSAPPRHK
jgi:uncharacterized protein